MSHSIMNRLHRHPADVRDGSRCVERQRERLGGWLGVGGGEVVAMMGNGLMHTGREGGEGGGGRTP